MVGEVIMDTSHIMLLEVDIDMGALHTEKVVLFNAQKISEADALRAVQMNEQNEYVLSMSRKQWIGLFCNGKNF